MGTCPVPGTMAPTASTGAPTTMAPTAATTCSTYCSDDLGYLACDGTYCDTDTTTLATCSECSSMGAGDQTLVHTLPTILLLLCPSNTCGSTCASGCAAAQECLSMCSGVAGVEQFMKYAFGCSCTFSSGGGGGSGGSGSGNADEGSTIKPLKLAFVAAVLGAAMV